MRKIIRRTKGSTEPIVVKVSLQDVVDLNWALYLSRMNEVIAFQNAKSRGDETGCTMCLDELKCISRADDIVNGIFDQIMSCDPEVEENGVD